MILVVDHETIVPLYVGCDVGFELREPQKHFAENFGVVFRFGIFRIKPVKFDVQLLFKIGFDQKSHDKRFPQK